MNAAFFSLKSGFSVCRFGKEKNQPKILVCFLAAAHIVAHVMDLIHLTQWHRHVILVLKMFIMHLFCF